MQNLSEDTEVSIPITIDCNFLLHTRLELRGRNQLFKKLKVNL